MRTGCAVRTCRFFASAADYLRIFCKNSSWLGSASLVWNARTDSPTSALPRRKNQPTAGFIAWESGSSSPCAHSVAPRDHCRARGDAVKYAATDATCLEFAHLLVSRELYHPIESNRVE